MENKSFNLLYLKVCQRSFKTEGKMEEHVANHSNGTKLHQCSECGHCFEGSGDLNIHKRNKHKQKFGPRHYNIPCNDCGRMFKNNAEMEKHQENHYNGTKLYLCPECGFAYENNGSMQAHKYEKHVKPFSDKTPKSKKEKTVSPEVQKRTCPVCARIFEDEAMKEAHVINHNNNMDMIKCESCLWQFELQEAYAHHVEKTHKRGGGGKGGGGGTPGRGSLTCDTCGRTFKSDAKKVAHIQNHMNDVTMYNCGYCSFEFEDEDECSQHEEKCANSKSSKSSSKKNATVGKYPCEFCGRRFQSETIMAMHVQLHLKNAPMHKCEECGWEFDAVHQLTYHLKTHKGDKKTPSKRGANNKRRDSVETTPPATVCEQCDRQFFYEYQMRAHLANHFNGSVLYKCEYCTWTYEKESMLAPHIEDYHPFYAQSNEFERATVRTSQRFICPLCGRIFATKLLYIQHLAFHTEMPFKCPYAKCGWVFCDFKQFQTHKAQKHHETRENLQYRLEKMAAEGGGGDAGEEKAGLEESLSALNDPSTLAGKARSFALTCPRCRVECATKKEYLSHTKKCKTSYTCGICKLCFDSFTEFELHLIPDEMECEVCKKKFPSECIIQTHLVSQHFSAEMIDESEKQQSMIVEEEEKKAEAELSPKKDKDKDKKDETPKAATPSKTPVAPKTDTTDAKDTNSSKKPTQKTPKVETPKSETPKVKPAPASKRRRGRASHTAAAPSKPPGAESDDGDNNNDDVTLDDDDNASFNPVEMSTVAEEKPAAAAPKRKRFILEPLVLRYLGILGLPPYQIS